jgi:hypothetical protein
MSLIMKADGSKLFKEAVIGWYSIGEINGDYDFRVHVWDSDDKRIVTLTHNTAFWEVDRDISSENFDDMFQHLVQDAIKELSPYNLNNLHVDDKVKIIKGKKRLNETGIIFKIISAKTFDNKDELKVGVRFSENFDLIPNTRRKGSHKKWIDAEWIWASFVNRVLPDEEIISIHNAAFEIAINKIKELRGI